MLHNRPTSQGPNIQTVDLFFKSLNTHHLHLGNHVTSDVTSASVAGTEKPPETLKFSNIPLSLQWLAPFWKSGPKGSKEQ